MVGSAPARKPTERTLTFSETPPPLHSPLLEAPPLHAPPNQCSALGKLPSLDSQLPKEP